MAFRGEITVTLQFLCIVDSAAHWFMSISRIDQAVDSALATYDQQPITPDIVAHFIPNWHTVQWHSVEKSAPPLFIVPFAGESYARDLEYEINIAHSAGPSLTHEQVRQAFQQFMEPVGS